MSKRLLQRIQLLEQRPPPATACREGLMLYRLTGKLPANPRVRQKVQEAIEFINAAKEATSHPAELP